MSSTQETIQSEQAIEQAATISEPTKKNQITKLVDETAILEESEIEPDTEPQMTGSLKGISTQLTVTIFKFLETADLFNLIRSNRYFRHHIEKDPASQDKIRLLMLEHPKFKAELHAEWLRVEKQKTSGLPGLYSTAIQPTYFSLQLDFLKSPRISRQIRTGALKLKNALTAIAPKSISGLTRDYHQKYIEASPPAIPNSFYMDIYPQLGAIRLGLYPSEVRHPAFGKEQAEYLAEIVNHAETSTKEQIKLRREAELVQEAQEREKEKATLQWMHEVTNSEVKAKLDGKPIKSLEKEQEKAAPVRSETQVQGLKKLFEQAAANKRTTEANLAVKKLTAETKPAKKLAADPGATVSTSDSTPVISKISLDTASSIAEKHKELQTELDKKRQREDDLELENAVVVALEKAIADMRGLTQVQVKGLRLGLEREQVSHSNFNEGQIACVKKYKQENLKATKEEIQQYYSTIKSYQAMHLSGMEVGFTKEDLASDWFSDKHPELVLKGFSIETLRGLNKQQVVVFEITNDREIALKSRCTPQQLQYMRQGVPYSEVEGLTDQQLYMLSELKFSRQDILKYKPEYHHAELCKMGHKLQEIYDLTQSEAELLKLGAPLSLVKKFKTEIGLNPQISIQVYQKIFLGSGVSPQTSPQTSKRTLQEEKLYMEELELAFGKELRSRLKSMNFMIENPQSLGKELGLSEADMREGNTNSIVLYLFKLKDEQNKSLDEIRKEYENIKKLTHDQLQGYQAGFTIEDVKSSWYTESTFHICSKALKQPGIKIEDLSRFKAIQIRALSRGISLETVKSKKMTDAFINNEHDVEKIMERTKCKIEELCTLHWHQIFGMARLNLSLEQVKHPNYNYSLYHILNSTDKQYSYEALIALKPWQCELFSEALYKNKEDDGEMSLTLEVFKQPWITPIHIQGLDYFQLKEIEGLTVLQVKALLAKPDLTLEQVTAPWFRSEHLMALEEGFEYEDIKGLTSAGVNQLREKGVSKPLMLSRGGELVTKMAMGSKEGLSDSPEKDDAENEMETSFKNKKFL